MAYGSIALRVRMSDLLRNSLTEEGLDPAITAENFAEWKAAGPHGELTSYYFGRDILYRRPLHNGQMILRHAHMPPEDPVEEAAWATAYRRRRTRTSDTCLIYAQEPRHGYLLLAIVREEPIGAHDFAEMMTPETASRMNAFCNAAAAFIHDGSIVL